MSASLYHRVLGDRFDLLPAALKQFHDRSDGGRAHGEFQVQRGDGRIRNWLASLLGLPRAGTRVPVRLHVVVVGDRERWIRDFDGVRMETIQWADGGRSPLLIEAAGLMRFGLELGVDATGLHYESRRAWIYFLPLPGIVVPKIKASIRVGEGAEWHVDVRVTDPLGSLLLAYQGRLHID